MLSKLKVGARMGLGFGVILAAAAAMATVAVTAFSQFKKASLQF